MCHSGLSRGQPQHDLDSWKCIYRGLVQRTIVTRKMWRTCGAMVCCVGARRHKGLALVIAVQNAVIWANNQHRMKRPTPFSPSAQLPRRRFGKLSRVLVLAKSPDRAILGSCTLKSMSPRPAEKTKLSPLYRQNASKRPYDF